MRWYKDAEFTEEIEWCWLAPFDEILEITLLSFITFSCYNKEQVETRD